MRGPNDRRLAEQATGIDLILGGHDHDYFSQKVLTQKTLFPSANACIPCMQIAPVKVAMQGLLDSECRNFLAVAAIGPVGVVSDAGVQVTNVVLLHVSLAMPSIVRFGFIFSKY